ncbi:kunitz-type trypsin inhibitor-like 1 protein [Arachis ipaensis]|uniref:kunitz-type trypsin inhibitor-like 1 protein n=1 Tax=Arachis ipaensis TaxID=130454 RepID=UPI0007AF2412|nr:kunitz-type trypsin inhibitor-like 1 protein [Arachis ipaensis]
MKPTLLITLSFLFALITYIFPLAYSQTVFIPVKDIHGNDVVTGIPYQIRQLTPGNPTPHGGGLIHGKTGNSTCPVSVAYTTGLMFGSPVKFNIPEWANTPGKIVPQGVPLEIEFSDENPLECASSSQWMVYGDNIETQKAVVGIGGPLDHPDQNTLFGYFNIRESQVGYNFMFCYMFQGSPLCSDVGTHLQNYPASLLVLTAGNLVSDPVFYFGLEKTDSDSSGIIKTVAY